MLHNERSGQAKVLDNFAMRGIKQSVVDMYNQKAHFIYELLQNADDAKATRATFELYPDKLVFRHNGKERFTISEEREDIHPYGHINAITAIGFSGKQDDEGNKIGKFGIGFKAIYQYSSTPEIYDDTFCFKIEKFVIPTQLRHDYTTRQRGETIFVFPFDNPKHAFNDVKEKIQGLNNPILFLRNLKTISIEINGKKSSDYSKRVKYTSTIDDIEHRLIDIINHGETSTLHLFTRSITVNGESKDNYFISVGYYLTKEGQLDIKRRPNVFCFFPTSEKFGDICCICHGPFELVNSRQQLKATDFNKQIKNLLAVLAADALSILRDYYIDRGKKIFNKNIIEMIPPSSGWYDSRSDEEFREKFIEKIQEEPLLLNMNREYSLPEDLMIAEDSTLQNLISDEQLNQLWECRSDDEEDEDEEDNIENCVFIHESLRDMQDNEEILTDILEIGMFSASSFLNAITPKFMELQSYDWVKRLYNYLHRNAHETWQIETDKNHYNYAACSSPIVKTSANEWISAYNRRGELNVFMPIQHGNKEDIYNFVNEAYLKEDITRNFLRALGISVPDSWSYIVSVIFTKCREENCSSEDFINYFEFIYKYVRDLEPDVKSEKLKEIRKAFGVMVGENTYSPLTNTVFFDSTELKIFMKGQEANIIDSAQYASFRSKYGIESYNSFLRELGIEFKPAFKTQRYGWIPSQFRGKFKIGQYSEIELIDHTLANLEEFLQNSKKTKESSIVLWNWLNEFNLEKYGYASCRYKYYTWHSAGKVESTFKMLLLNHKWILLGNKWYAPNEVYLEDLEAEGYTPHEAIIRFFNIGKRERDLKELGLTDEEVNRSRLGKMVEDYGLSEEEAKEAFADFLRKKTAERLQQESSREYQQENSSSNISTQEKTREIKRDDQLSAIEKKKKEWEKLRNAPNGRPATSQKASLGESSLDIQDSRNEDDSNDSFFDDKPSHQHQQSNQDKRTRATEKFKRKNTEAEKAAEKSKDAQELIEIFEQTEPYTYMWFKLLMDLQLAEHKRSCEREFEVSFVEYELTNFGKGLLLKNSSKDIPHWIENAGELQITLCSQDKQQRIASAIIKVDSDSVELSIDPKDGKKLVDIIQIKLLAKDSINHIDSLRQRFIQLGFDDDFNLNDNLKKDIQFIYGPPGTGKTTRLVQRLSEMLKNPTGPKNILILTPTNKAADVIAKKLFNDDVCGDYLVRFGVTEDRDLIEEAIVESRDTFFIDNLDKNIVVTTIARFAYDCFQPDDCAICDFDWDFIVIDEASMIDIVPMVYVLYKVAETSFLIAGDPKQIEPVTQNDMPNYNIYDMVGLDSFKEAIKNYKRFPLEALTTQHRSVPSIGNMVSLYAYDGMVKHDIARIHPKHLKIEGFNILPINFIGFPTKLMDRLYGVTEIGKSSFHLYSAILTYNWAKYLASAIEKKYPDTSYSIGIVTPYKAQADAIAQMEEHQPMSSSNCIVTVGTVHRFQGDECDIMILLLNPPANPTENSHINNENIINVAMSRARDYIFLMMPQGQYDGYDIKRKLRDIAPMKSIIMSSDIEKKIFGIENYIECNTNVTCHLPVNVYSDSLSKYEVRISDTALDIQIND